MLFNSYEFLFIYFPITLCLYFLIAKANKRYGIAWLTIASLFFYGWWNPKFITLLLASIAFNYMAGRIIATKHNKTFFIGAVAANFLSLLYFKYVNFFLGTVNTLGGNLQPIDVILPLGISFFTFTQVAFLVDCFKSEARELSPLNYALFVTWFPHLIAGPILHHKEMMLQFAASNNSNPNHRFIAIGLTIFAFGLLKKVMLADQYAPFVSPVFNVEGASSPALFATWSATLSYTLQLYFDFSAYSDMAIGLSLMFNIVLPKNFDSPYKASNMIDFWRRWHMTLSRFLRDYLYFPLGGNRKGKWHRHFNLFITMLLGGMWHGAGWGFIIWGGLHGLYLIINHAWRASFLSRIGQDLLITKILGIAITFLAVAWAWVPFRAESLTTTLSIWKGMIGENGVETSITMTQIKEFAMIGMGLAIVWLLPNLMRLMPSSEGTEKANDSHPPNISLDWKTAILVGAVLCISILSMNHASEFLYFQF